MGAQLGTGDERDLPDVAYPSSAFCDPALAPEQRLLPSPEIGHPHLARGEPALPGSPPQAESGATLDGLSSEPLSPGEVDIGPAGANRSEGGSAPLPPPPAGHTSPPVPLSLRIRLLTATLLTVVVLFVLFSPWPLDAKLRTIGHACCAQIPSHTIRFDGRAMPIDARNSGIYLGVFLVIAMLWLTGRQRAALYVPSSLRNLLLGFTAAMILDGFNSLQHTQHLAGLYPESNTMRTITGTLAGVSLTILVVPLFNRIVWREPEAIAIAEDFTELAGYLGGGVLLILALLQAPAALYWPLSILSIAGLLITLTMVNTAIVLVSLRRERSVASERGLFIPALGGLVFTLFEILLLLGRPR